MKRATNPVVTTLVFLLGMTATAGSGCGGKSANVDAAPETGGAFFEGDGDSGTGGGGAAGGATGGQGGSAGGQIPMGGSVGRALGTLGDDCASVGAFACAEDNLRLALVCGGDGTWESRETCAGDSYCDSNSGTNEGLCRIPLAECEGSTGPFCEDKMIVECQDGGFDKVHVETCAEDCREAECVWMPDPCPETGTNCSEDECENPMSGCLSGNCQIGWLGGVSSQVPATTVRLAPNNICESALCDRDIFVARVLYDDLPEQALRITIGKGWGMVPYDDGDYDACGALQSDCLIVPPQVEEQVRGAVLVPLSEEAVTRNLIIEAVDPGTTCD